MITYISLLRGINVSGQKKLPMKELRELLSDKQLHDVQTYIQSGNVVLKAAGLSPQEVSETISKKIEKKFGYGVPVMTLIPEQVRKAMNKSPFKSEAQDTPNKTFICFLAEQPGTELLNVLDKLKYEGEFMQVEKDHIHLYFPQGAGKAKLNNNLIEKKLKVKATTRNWRTLEKLLGMAADD